MNPVEEILQPLTADNVAGIEADLPGELTPQGVADARVLEEIYKLNDEFENRYKDKLSLQPSLSRSLVSFQANKGRAVYRWFKYKEAFSAGLVEYLLNKYRVSGGMLLDPFGGIGTALFAAGALGMRAEGIELRRPELNVADETHSTNQ